MARLPAAASRDSYKLGCYTRPWDQFDYRIAFDGIAEAGFQFVGLMTAKGMSSEMINPDTTPEVVHSIAHEVKERGLKTLSIYGGDLPAAKSVPAAAAGLRKLIDYAVICSCPNLLLGGTTEEHLVKRYYQAVAECCDYARNAGVGLSIKPHGGQNSTGLQCRKLIEQVGHQNFRLWYDPGNIFYYSDGKLDPVDDCATVDGLVVGMSVKDYKKPKDVLLTPGTGLVNFAQVLSRLREGGFRSGPLVIECLTVSDTAAKITAEAKQARHFLNLVLSNL
jgi:sugar phosphate isomerase/epimerase